MQSALIPHSQHACFSCPNESCAGGDKEENKYIRLHETGASEATTIAGGQFTCYYCGAQLVEDIGLRTLASKDQLKEMLILLRQFFHKTR